MYRWMGTCCLVLGLSLGALGGPPTAKTTPVIKNHHKAPVTLQFTDADGVKRNLKVIAQGPFENSGPNPEAAWTNGTAKVPIYLDTIKAITDIDAKNGANFVLFNGTTQHLTFGAFQECLIIEHMDGSREKLDMRKFKSIEALNY